MSRVGIYIDATTGNLGIGTTAPTSILHVRPNSTTAGVIIDQVGTGDIIDVRDGGVSKVMVDGNGNVGVGTTVPQQKLDVNGNIQLNNNIHNASGRPILKQTGGVLNVVNNLVGTTGLINTSQYIISQSITPSTTSSKILVMAAFHGEKQSTTATHYAMVNLYRDAVNLLSLNNGFGYQVNANVRQHGNASYLDSPNTTSAITYRIYADFSQAGGTGFHFYGITLTCMEIAG